MFGLLLTFLCSFFTKFGAKYILDLYSIFISWKIYRARTLRVRAFRDNSEFWMGVLNSDMMMLKNSQRNTQSNECVTNVCLREIYKNNLWSVIGVAILCAYADCRSCMRNCELSPHRLAQRSPASSMVRIARDYRASARCDEKFNERGIAPYSLHITIAWITFSMILSVMR